MFLPVSISFKFPRTITNNVFNMHPTFPVHLEVVGVEKGSGFVIRGEVKRELRSIRESMYRSTRGVGEYSLSRLCPPTLLVTARNAMAY